MVVFFLSRNCCSRTTSDHERSDWACGLPDLFVNINHTTSYPLPQAPLPVTPAHRCPIQILLVFDGIGISLLTLKQLGLKIGKFVASEIDESVIRLVENHHSCVVDIGDVTKLSESDVRRLGPFDLVIGGSPCNDLSGASFKCHSLLNARALVVYFDFF